MSISCTLQISARSEFAAPETGRKDSPMLDHQGVHQIPQSTNRTERNISSPEVCSDRLGEGEIGSERLSTEVAADDDAETGDIIEITSTPGCCR